MVSVKKYPYTEIIDQDVEIDGFPFYAESITPNEAYTRRDLKRTKILNGAETATQGDWIGRDFSFSANLQVEKNHHEMYDDIFMELMSKPCEVVCRDMGPIFDAEVIIKKSPITAEPYSLNVEVQVKEIADVSSYFPDFVTNSNFITITNGPASKEDLEAAKAQSNKKSSKSSEDTTSSGGTN